MGEQYHLNQVKRSFFKELFKYNKLGPAETVERVGKMAFPALVIPGSHKNRKPFSHRCEPKEEVAAFQVELECCTADHKFFDANAIADILGVNRRLLRREIRDKAREKIEEEDIELKDFNISSQTGYYLRKRDGNLELWPEMLNDFKEVQVFTKKQPKPLEFSAHMISKLVFIPREIAK